MHLVGRGFLCVHKFPEFVNSGVQVYADLPVGYASQLCIVSRRALQCVSMDECALLHVLVEHTFFSMGLISIVNFQFKSQAQR